MRSRIPLFVTLLILALPGPARALDPSPSVSAVTVMKTSRNWAGEPIAYPQGRPEITGLIVEIPPGAETGWHSHPVPSFGVVLEGELEIRLKDGRVNLLKPGDMVAEVVDLAHNGRNIGTTPVKLAVFYAGEAGTPLTTPERGH